MLVVSLFRRTVFISQQPNREICYCNYNGQNKQKRKTRKETIKWQKRNEKRRNSSPNKRTYGTFFLSSYVLFSCWFGGCAGPLYVPIQPLNFNLPHTNL